MTKCERSLFLALVCLVSLSASAALGQRRKPSVQPQSSEEWIIRQITVEPDPDQKRARLKDFLTQYPKSDSAPWALELIQDLSIAASQHAKAIQAGEQLLKLDPDDLETAHKNLKSAEALKDPALVKSAAEAVWQIAKRTPVSSGDLARQLIAYTDYLAYVEILAASDPKKRVPLLDQYTAQRPESAYITQVRDLYFTTFQQLGDTANALASAQRMIDRQTTNEDALLFVAESHFANPREGDRAIAVATRLAEVLTAKPKPEGMSAEDWARKKNQLSGHAYWIIGKTSMDQRRFARADRALRSALPYLRGNDALTAAALFHLGWANYQLGNHAEAIKFNQQCLAYKSTFREQAAKNLAAIQAERK